MQNRRFEPEPEPEVVPWWFAVAMILLVVAILYLGIDIWVIARDIKEWK